MPGTLCHIAFGEMVYRKLDSNMPLNKIEFLSGNLIPDLSAEDKKLSHYRKEASVMGLFVPDMKRVEKELFVHNPIKLGMYAHLYLDERFIEGFLIPSFIWYKPTMTIINPRNGLKWSPGSFFKLNGVYYQAFEEINQMLIRDGYISMETILGMPEILPDTGMPVFDKRQNKPWKKEIEEYMTTKREYTGAVFDYESLMSFLKETANELADKINKII